MSAPLDSPTLWLLVWCGLLAAAGAFLWVAPLLIGAH